MIKYDEWRLLVANYEDDTPENRADGEKQLREAGVKGDIRIMAAYSIVTNLHPLRMDGYKLERAK